MRAKSPHFVLRHLYQEEEKIMPIHFGTDGWRAVISDSFTFDNLRMVSQAIADAVASDHWDKSPNVNPNKIVIGYDTRFLSDRFAGEVARVLAANGFTVLLAQADSPTPAISYAVKTIMPLLV
jgi:phosphomannomutase